MGSEVMLKELFRRQQTRALPSIAMLGVHKYKIGNYEEAYSLLKKAADAGDLLALRFLFYYAEGHACAKNVELATKFIEQAIAQGCVQSIFLYAKILNWNAC